MVDLPGDGFRPPPHSIEAEVSVLGGLFVARELDREGVVRCLAVLEESHFFREANRHIYRAMVELTAEGTAVDPLTVQEVLRDRGQLEVAGGVDYLAQLAEMPSAANIEHHAGVVRDKAYEREALDALTQGIGAIHDLGRPSEVLDTVGELVEAARSRVGPGSSNVIRLQELLEDPELLQPPIEIIPKLAWKGRVTLLYGQEKLGKSTYIAAALAALTMRPRSPGSPAGIRWRRRSTARDTWSVCWICRRFSRTLPA